MSVGQLLTAIVYCIVIEDRVLEFIAANNQQFAKVMKSSQTQNKTTKSTRTKLKPESEKDLDTRYHNKVD